MDKQQENRIFADEPIVSATLKLAIPSMMGQIILVVYNMADTFFIGLTGSDAMITAVTVCLPAFMFLSAISNLFGVGASGVISRSMGMNDSRKAADASSFAFWGCLLAASVYSLGTRAFCDGFINLLGGTDPAVHANALKYLRYTVIIGGVPTALNTLLSHLTRSEGRSYEAAAGVVFGGVLNIVLDPLFMFKLLPPGSEAAGAAMATAVSNTAAALYFLTVLKKSDGPVKLGFRPGSLKNGLPAELASGGPWCWP